MTRSARVMANLNQMADIIRERKTISLGELGAQMKLAPSTLYGYATYMPYIFEDIAYRNGLFRVQEPKKEDPPVG